MPEIGATLREARMRARIDITEVEEATKIRAKYLRALENEEWSLLPGSTFVKSFLREYADYLGLDARLLVEEYKLRYERPSEHELAPISPSLGGRDRRGGGGGRGIPPRWVVVSGLVVVLLVALWALGSLGGSGGGGGSQTSGGNGKAAATPARTSADRRAATTATGTPSLASVRLIATGAVYACLVDDTGKVLIRGATLSAGQSTRVYRAPSMRLTLGNNAVRLRVNGREVTVPPSSQAIAYEVTATGARPLPASKAPTCT